MRHSAALTTDLDARLVAHLRRSDGDEDVCFATWHPSQGATRLTTVLRDVILPEPGERAVHGNVTFTSEYFLRAAAVAAAQDAGLALLHSHPLGRGWQAMSADDIAAEHGHAAATLALTGRSLVGLTLAGVDGGWSARAWTPAGNGRFARADCESVRVVGDRIAMTYHPVLRPVPVAQPSQVRTVSAWGPAIQADLVRLRVVIVGAGSVGALVAEALARVGITDIVLIDFDTVRLHNLDRLLHAMAADAHGRVAKVHSLARGLALGATALDARISALELSVVEEDGLRAALDGDVIFSCVDRPWPRSVLNLAALAHLVPVVDGGIRVVSTGERLINADWKAHLVAPGRRCMECLGQYSPELVALEREGRLDDPNYIEGLPDDHPLKVRENVFPFSMAVASLEVLQLLAAVVAPQGVSDPGAQNYHFVTGDLDLETRDCEPRCWDSANYVALGDDAGVTPTGPHQAAADERAYRNALTRDGNAGDDGPGRPLPCNHVHPPQKGSA